MRIKHLQHHADLILADAEREVPNRSDLEDVIRRGQHFQDTITRRDGGAD
jgi:hypothetical protein